MARGRRRLSRGPGAAGRSRGTGPC
jgi:hypothetical protein